MAVKPIRDRLNSTDRLVALRALQEVLAGQLADPDESTTLSMMAAAAKELRSINAELAGLVPSKEVSKLDDLRARRQARHSDTADPAPAARRGQPRKRAGGNRVG